ncbi:MAG: hypothetical protein APZ16_06970 [Candidatus Hadarchaeum yellowstonense]|uniref:Uncharacterized protein n=1 Tax=Hadarchaeum yellowstonense TaxID=1776334 RepID=A0A147K087_HADYE|nr:MAG: hypothetical protein APZ16_06970 [Candidatus Hadarchaeum yellowstonense]
MWWKAMAILLVVLVFVVAIATLYATNRWQSHTRALHARMEAVRVPITPTSYDSRELEGLPAPVQLYFRTVLQEGQPLVAAVSVEHTGTFNMSEVGEKWKPFTSTQRVITQRPGFVWDARIRMAPGMTVYVHDAYVAGEGILTAKLFGLMSLVNLRGTPEVAQGELMRFFAEAAWYPTALLPSQGVQWEAVDDVSAKATLKDGETTLTMLFRFNESGLIESVRAEARGRTVAGAVIPTPWEGRWSNYELRDGMRIPLEGEVAWILPEGPKPYWRGRIQRIQYELSNR